MSLLRSAVLLGALLAAVGAADTSPAPTTVRQRPLLGLTLGDPEPLAGAPGLPVQRVAPGGAAEAMGVRAGDRVLSGNGRDIATAADLAKVIDALGAGGELRLALTRDGQRLEVSGALAPPPTPQQIAQQEEQLQARLDRLAAMPRDESAQVRRLLAGLARLERGLAPAREGFAGVYPDGELSLTVSVDIRSDAAAADAKEIAAPGPAPLAPAATPPTTPTTNGEPPRASAPAP